IVRASVPAPTPAQRARVDTAVRRVCESAAGDLPPHWQEAVRRAAGARAGDLRDALDAAVVGTDLNSVRTPLSWRLVGLAQWLLVAAALVGVGWLALLAVDGSLGLPKPPGPKVGALPAPVPLLVGSVLLGLLLSWGGRQVARGRATARRRRAETRLRAGIEEVAERLVLAPVSEELARHESARQALERARTG
ncbi:MAG TPA: ABC transporter, partial [Candidatus Eisenbacteria bacterium]|nr:ABC transporter [Candidatus Eisenbacteria bacterium]